MHHNMLCRRLRVKGGAFTRAARLMGMLFFGVVVLCACSREAPPTATPAPVVETAAPLPDVMTLPAVVLTPTPFPYPWTNENALMNGVCFEAADDAAGRTFVLRSREDLAHFYDLADNSELCRHPIARADFDFSDGQILAGTWSRGAGCHARHDVQNVQRDDTARTLFIFLRLVTEGDCAYELVRPFWIGISGASGYDVQFIVE